MKMTRRQAALLRRESAWDSEWAERQRASTGAMPRVRKSLERRRNIVGIMTPLDYAIRKGEHLAHLREINFAWPGRAN